MRLAHGLLCVVVRCYVDVSDRDSQLLQGRPLFSVIIELVPQLFVYRALRLRRLQACLGLQYRLYDSGGFREYRERLIVLLQLVQRDPQF